MQQWLLNIINPVKATDMNDYQYGCKRIQVNKDQIIEYLNTDNYTIRKIVTKYNDLEMKY